MKRCIGLVIILMLCGNPFVSAEEFNSYKSASFNFIMRYPQSWEMNTLKDMEVMSPVVKNEVAFLSPLENKDDKFRENVNVVVEDLSGRQLDSEQYAKAADAAWLKYDNTSKIVDFQKTNLNGEVAYYTIMENDKLKFKQYKLVKDNKAFVITFTSEPDKFDDFLNIADNIIQSFELK